MKIENDFPDIITPVLVKELRQEMRVRSFVISFIGLHLFMIFSVFLSLINSSGGMFSSEASTMSSFVFWMAAIIPPLFVIPFRGFSSLTKETQANALELMQITKLTSWQIIFGKWAALSLESLLVISSILPYAILRYLIGVTGLMESFIALSSLFACSVTMSALIICQSSTTTKKRPSGFLAILFIVLLWPFGAFVEYFFSFFRGAPIGSSVYLPLFVFVPLIWFLLIEIGASRIASPNENYSFRKRLIGIIAIAAGALFLKFGAVSTHMVWPFVCAILFLVIFDGFCENPKYVLSVYAKKRIGPRISQYLWYPGWPGGILYAIVISLVVLGSLYLVDSKTYSTEITIGFLLLGGFLQPLILVRWVVPESKHKLFSYLIAQLFLICITIMMVFALDGSAIAYGLFPFSALGVALPRAYSSFRIDSDVAQIAYISTIVTIFIALMFARKPLAKMRELQNRALKMKLKTVSE